jgi:hypothetical protein
MEFLPLTMTNVTKKDNHKTVFSLNGRNSSVTTLPCTDSSQSLPSLRMGVMSPLLPVNTERAHEWSSSDDGSIDHETEIPPAPSQNAVVFRKRGESSEDWSQFSELNIKSSRHSSVDSFDVPPPPTSSPPPFPIYVRDGFDSWGDQGKCDDPPVESTINSHHDDMVSNFDEDDIFSSSSLFAPDMRHVFDKLQGNKLNNRATEVNELTEIKRYLEKILNKLKDEDTGAVYVTNVSISYSDLLFLDDISDWTKTIMAKEKAIVNKQEIEGFSRKILDPIRNHFHGAMADFDSLEVLENMFYYNINDQRKEYI